MLGKGASKSCLFKGLELKVEVMRVRRVEPTNHAVHFEAVTSQHLI